MRICFWGTYTIAEGYPVNRVLTKGLRRSGGQLREVREQIWDGFLHAAWKGSSAALAWRIVRRAIPAYMRLMARFVGMPECDVVVVGYAGYFDVLVARLLMAFGRRRPLVLVAFISLYDTVVVDRRQVAPRSWKARMLKRIDAAAFRAADLVLVDTEAQRRYFARLFALPEERFQRSFVGEDDEVFRSGSSTRPRPEAGRLRVLFFGTYVPLHGVEFIIEAAEILKEEEGFEFTLIGNGQQYARTRSDAAHRRLDRLQFVSEWVRPSALVDYIDASDICLGIFGTTDKAARVIPYKVYDALAVGRPVVTRDSPAIREILVHEKSALLCPPGDGAALAAALTRLLEDRELRLDLAARGRETYLQRAAPEAVGRDLLAVLSDRYGC